MTISAYRGRCPHCGHDHDQILFHTSDREELDRLRAEVAKLVADTNRQLVAIAEYDAEIASLKEEQKLAHSNLNNALIRAEKFKRDYRDLRDDLTQQLAECKRQLAEALERIEYLKYYGEDT